MWSFIIEGKLTSPNVQAHWSKKYKLNKTLEHAIRYHYIRDKPQLELPAIIELTRISPKAFDFDNLVSSFKGIRDTIAQLMYPGTTRGQADNSEELEWRYLQKKGLARQYQIEINIYKKI